MSYRLEEQVQYKDTNLGLARSQLPQLTFADAENNIITGQISGCLHEFT